MYGKLKMFKNTNNAINNCYKNNNKKTGDLLR